MAFPPASPAGSPSLAISPSVVSLEPHEGADTAAGEFQILNKSDRAVIISSIEASCGCILAKAESEILAPGEGTRVTLRVKLIGKAGPFDERIRIISDLETREIRVVGTGKAGPRFLPPLLQLGMLNTPIAVSTNVRLSAWSSPIRDGAELGIDAPRGIAVGKWKYLGDSEYSIQLVIEPQHLDPPRRNLRTLSIRDPRRSASASAQITIDVGYVPAFRIEPRAVSLGILGPSGVQSGTVRITRLPGSGIDPAVQSLACSHDFLSARVKSADETSVEIELSSVPDRLPSEWPDATSAVLLVNLRQKGANAITIPIHFGMLLRSTACCGAGIAGKTDPQPERPKSNEDRR